MSSLFETIFCLVCQFSAFLIATIFSEFGGAVWALISRVNFENEMAIAMEVSLSSYTTDKAVAENWKSLQQQVIVPEL
jgi:endonuclease III